MGWLAKRAENSARIAGLRKGDYAGDIGGAHLIENDTHL